MNRFFKFKTLLFLMLFAFAGQNAWAENYSWFNFDVYVKAKVKTADGLVYDNPETGTVYAKLACNSSEKENHEYAHTHPSNASDVQSYSLDATLHAIPNTGFKFLYWTKEDGSIISASETEQNDGKATVACNATLRCFYGEKGSGDSNHDASHKSLIQQYGTYSNIFNYYAVFEPISASIAVKSNNTSIPIEFSTDGTTWKSTLSEANVTNAAINMNSAAQTKTVYWRWAYDVSAARDTADTNLGVAAQTSPASVTLSATISATQAQ